MYSSSFHKFTSIILAVLTSAVAQNPLIRNDVIRIPNTKAADFRLPRDLKPLDYSIQVQPIFQDAIFNGQSRFRFEALQTTNKIVLHSSGLIIQDTQVLIYDDHSSIRFGVTLEESGDEKEFLTLTLNGTLKVGETYSVVFASYVGKLYNDNSGFYLGEYTAENGETRIFATTQFESTGARRVFPCMDEPEYKAIFELSIIREKQYISTSNMPIYMTLDVDGYKNDVYYKTLPMSTYLLAFTVSDFAYISNAGTMNWVYARPEAIRAGHAEYALSVAGLVLDEIANFTGVYYAWPKMDQVSIPDRYFSAGAMENWGQVTYRDSLLLFDPDVSTTANKQSILNTISHEFGHQWFGNLATPKWWEYLWLSEGFATYLSYIGARVGAPSWIVEQFFTTSSLHNALDRDSVSTTRPMNQEVGSPAQIEWMFDVISYDKGACIIRMLEAILSTHAFQNGLQNYLNEMAFQAAVPEDLYKQLAIEITHPSSLPTDKTLEEVMSAWTDVAGYPLVSVKKWSSQAFFMEQEHFVTDGTPRDTLWPIPVNWAVEGNANFNDVLPMAWLQAKQSVVKYTGDIPENAWYIMNKQQTSYFRVNYDIENWKKLVIQLMRNYDAIHPLNRAQLLDDSFYLARHGRLDFAVPLDLTRYLATENYYAPLNVFYKMLTFLNKFMAREVNYKNFQAYVAVILKGQHDYLGSDPTALDNQMDVLNRLNALAWIAKTDFGGEQFQTKALAAVKGWLQGASGGMAPDMQAPYFCAAMAIAETADWELVYNRFLGEKDATMRSRLLAGLGCSETNQIRDQFLMRAIDPASGFSPSEILNAFRGIYRSGNSGASYVYRYIIQNFYQLKEKTNVANLLEGVCALFTTSTDLAMVINNAETFGEVNGIFKTAIHRVEENYRWGSKYIVSIANWFANS